MVYNYTIVCVYIYIYTQLVWYYIYIIYIFSTFLDVFWPAKFHVNDFYSADSSETFLASLGIYESYSYDRQKEPT